MSLTFCENISSSVALGADGGGGAGAVTVTRAVASWVPPSPLAVRWYVVESSGVTCCEPLGCTAPMPSMVTSVALVVCQVSVLDWPLSTVLGLALSEAVGAAGGGGGGGGGGATFFLQAPSVMMAPSANTTMIHFSLACFTFPPCNVRARASGSRL